jgi:hypothetical protein
MQIAMTKINNTLAVKPENGGPLTFAITVSGVQSVAAASLDTGRSDKKITDQAGRRSSVPSYP